MINSMIVWIIWPDDNAKLDEKVDTMLYIVQAQKNYF